MKYHRFLINSASGIVFLTLFLGISDNNALGQSYWDLQLPGVGTFSSPRITDLNSDKVGDIVLGSGRVEFEACDSAVIAVDGKTGALLWSVSAKDQIFGSATLRDITNDGVEDVFIAGRSAELIAIDGARGEVLWRFTKNKIIKKEWFNFYNPQFIPDQSGDGIVDILVSNGGDVLAEPYDVNRRPGHLVVINSMNGEVIQRAPMPDGKETYMSISVLPNKTSEVKNVIFGTGGETVGGNLYVASINDIMSGDLSGSILLATGKEKGFIAAPAWVDITGDGNPDIVTNAFDGRLLAFDGITFKPVWSVKVENTEAYASVAIGNFNRDNTPDFFVSFSQGSWPDLDWCKQILVNGKNGNIEFIDSLGYYQMSSPVVLDINNDGIDEAILSVNYRVYDSLMLKYYYNDLVLFDFVGKEAVMLQLESQGHNISTTPWLGDLDDNGMLDIIYCHGTNVKKTYTFDGLQLTRLNTEIPIKTRIKWGAYMGSNYDGVYDAEKIPY